MKIYNERAITRQQRFQNALVVGMLVTFCSIFGYCILLSSLRIEFSVAYLAIGYFIGTSICKYGRGVQVRFSVLAAVLCILCFIINDAIGIYGVRILVEPSYWPSALQTIIIRLLPFNVSSLLSLLFRVGGVAVAYNNARI